jgi:polyphosphate kinase 2 (PPK2 family)
VLFAGENVAVTSKQGTRKLPRQLYETEPYRLQGELVRMQEWMRTSGARIVVIFEGRDAAAHPVVLPALR